MVIIQKIINAAQGLKYQLMHVFEYNKNRVS